MKKTYKKPITEVIEIKTEGVIAMSCNHKPNDPWGPGGHHENCKPGDHNHGKPKQFPWTRE